MAAFASTAATPPIAACICGQLRTFVRSDVRLNIAAAMVAPVRNEVDVFASISFNHNETRWGQGASETSVDEVRSWLRSIFAVHENDFEARNDPSVTSGLTPHASCLSLIVRKEAARQQAYKWVMRLRSDAVYGATLPPYIDWPSVSHQHQLTLFTTSCGPSPYDFNEQEKREGICVKVKPLPSWERPLSADDDPDAFASALGCVKDSWNLMTRAAANVGFNHSALTSAPEKAAKEHFSCLPQAQWHNECGLGCALHLHDVEVRALSDSVYDGSGLGVRFVRLYNPIHEDVKLPKSAFRFPPAAAPKSEFHFGSHPSSASAASRPGPTVVRPVGRKGPILVPSGSRMGAAG